ncbi:hypothetical protein ACFV2N_47645 [Streptomyces sp. NPDC059680]|uniref:hypothetical protein n=1 Tax=Streptomyces sp. NPDC059680 TaxID=3346904 RepID=UPI003689E3F5
MSRPDRNENLRTLLIEAQWSGGELASAVNRLGNLQSMELKYDRTSVAHWLRGSKPTATVATLVAAAFSRRIGRLVTIQETGLTKTSRKSELGLYDHLGHTDPLQRLVALAGLDSSPASRTLLTQSGYSLTTVPLPDWKNEPSSNEVHGARHQATTEDIEIIQSVIRIVADQAEHFGGRHGRSAVAAYLAEDVSRILAANASAALRRELCNSTAQLTYLLAGMTADAGYHGLAQSYYHTALNLAQDAGSRETYAVVLRAMSAQAFQLGHGRQALSLAEAAVAIAGTSSHGPTAAFLLGQLAVTHAYDSQRHSAIRELAAAETSLERFNGAPGPFTSYPRAGLEYQQSQVFLALGMRAEALRSLRACARHREPHEYRTSALTEFQLGEMLLTSGLLEEACTHWDRFLTHSGYVHSARIDQALNHLYKRLRAYQRQRKAAIVWDHLNALLSRRGLHTGIPGPRIKTPEAIECSQPLSGAEDSQ